MFIRRFKVRAHERGLVFRDGQFEDVMGPGVAWLFDPLRKLQVEIVDVRSPWLAHVDLDVIVRSGALRREARVVDLKAHERAIVWVDGRLEAVLKPGLYALWTVFRDVKVEIVDARVAPFEHEQLAAILELRGTACAGRGRHGRGGPRRPALPQRPPRGDARPGRLRVLEGRRPVHGRRRRAARADRRRRAGRRS